MKKNIFVSFSNKDIKWAKGLKKELELNNLSVFLSDHNIQTGEQIPEKIFNAIKKCSIFIVIYSRNSQESEWVSQEMGVAYGRKGIKKYPILLSNGCTPKAFFSDLRYFPAYEYSDGVAISKIVLELVGLAKDGKKKITSYLFSICGASSSGKDSILSEINSKDLLEKPVFFLTRYTSRTTSVMSSLKRRIKAFEFDSSLLVRKSPVYLCLLIVPVKFPSPDL